MERIGRYELGEVMGEGGSGRVHRAVVRDGTGLIREVALKLMDSGGAELEREARLGGLLRHVNLVDVYEVGEVDGTWFCAMELCEDGALTQHLPLPARAVVEVGLQVCAALGYAHRELGLVHLDLKPDNLLLDGATVKVADLGIASASGFAADTRIRGTRGYMAPEQSAGGVVDARTDVYALGVVLREMASGVVGAASQTFSFDDWDPAAQTAQSEPDVPWLEPVLERCLDPDPSARFDDMDALADALRGLDVQGPGLSESLGLQPPEASAYSRSNLGDEPDRFIGRESELIWLSDALSHGGLIVLKGPGGIGKTRLAIAAARAEHGRVGEEAWLCDLSEARSRQDVVQDLAATLGIRLLGQSTDVQLTQLGHALGGRGRPILILDNFEQVKSEADLAVGLLDAAPNARILVTSRERLEGIDAQTLDVDPLELETARALLIERARQRGADIANDPATEELAQRLEGVPLALELAAGRMGVLSAADILERLGLSLLRSGRADVTDRQATLRATLEWSWGLLTGAEQSAMAQISVFRGGFSLRAAEELLDCGLAPLEAIDALVARSLLRARDGRLQVLESVRSFAQEQLVDRGPMERRHARWYAQYGTWRALDALDRFGGTQRRRALAVERENLAHACEYAIAHSDLEAAAGTLRALFEILEMEGAFGRATALAVQIQKMPGATASQLATAAVIEARTLRYAGDLENALAAAERAVAHAKEGGDDRDIATTLMMRGTLRALRGDPSGGVEDTMHALEICKAAGLDDMEGKSNGNLGYLSLIQGRHDDAERHALRAIEIQQRVGNRRSEAVALGNLGVKFQHEGRNHEALEAMERGLAIHRQTGDQRFLGLTLSNLGVLYSDLGQTERALDCLRSSVDLQRRLGNRSLVGECLANLGHVLDDVGQTEEAHESLIASLEILTALQQPHWMGIVEGQLGSMALEDGDYEQAARRYRTARDIHEAIPDPVWAAIDVGYEGELALRQGRVDEARELLGHAASRLRRLHAHGWIRFATSLGTLERDMDLLNEAQKVATEAGWRRDLARVWLAQAEIGNTSEGLVERAQAIATETGCLELSPLQRAIDRTRAKLA